MTKSPRRWRTRSGRTRPSRRATSPAPGGPTWTSRLLPTAAQRVCPIPSSCRDSKCSRRCP
ncbi:hypothetical protein AB431_00690 [Mycobacterium sp. EPa45]|nr:hypothetical protein AB431_00690 [Mycobacterium sp. EPa45]